MNNIKGSSNRSFGIVFFIFFLIIAVYPIFYGQELRIWSLLLSLIFLILGLAKSRILTPLNLLWFKFGLLLGMVISPIIMGIIFFGIFSPIGIIMRLFKRDELSMIGNNKLSHWKIRKVSQIKSDLFKQQF